MLKNILKVLFSADKILINDAGRQIIFTAISTGSLATVFDEHKIKPKMRSQNGPTMLGLRFE
jgi:hypothetical protein